MYITKYFVDEEGVYQGSWEGRQPEDFPTGLIEVLFPPPIHASQKWNGEDYDDFVEDYNTLRQAEHPPIIEAINISFKQRQKAKLLVGKARLDLEQGNDLETLRNVIIILLEALEPILESHDYDAKILALYNKYPETSDPP